MKYYTANHGFCCLGWSRRRIRSGCFSICGYKESSLADGSCSALGCCQNPIPKHLKTVDINGSNLGQEGLVLCTVKLINPEWVRNNNILTQTWLVVLNNIPIVGGTVGGSLSFDLGICHFGLCLIGLLWVSRVQFLILIYD